MKHHRGVVFHLDHHHYDGDLGRRCPDRCDDHVKRHCDDRGDHHARAWADGGHQLCVDGDVGGGGVRHRPLMIDEFASVCRRGPESRRWVGLQYLRSGHCVTGKDLSSPGC